MDDEEEQAQVLASVYDLDDVKHPSEYFGTVGNIYEALLYSWLFWPTLIEIHGAVFVGVCGNNRSTIERRLVTPFGDGKDEPDMTWKDAVDSYNRFEVISFFSQWPRDFSAVPDFADLLVRKLVVSWRARLEFEYPDRAFAVEFMDSDDALEIGIEVVQYSPELTVPHGWNPRRRFIERTS